MSSNSEPNSSLPTEQSSSLESDDDKNSEKMILNKLQQVAASIVRASNGLPKMGDGYELYASYPDFAKFMEQQRLRIILVMRKLLANIGCRIKITAYTLEDMEKIIFANDLLVERVGISFEEHQRLLTQELIVKMKVNTGAEEIPGSSISALNNAGATSLGVKDGGRYAAMFGKNVESIRLCSSSERSLESSSVTIKPQRAFQESIVNADLNFVPKLIVKHNALKVIDKRNLRIIDEDSNSNEMLVNEKNWLNDSSFTEHPYAHELKHFVVPPHQLEPPKDIADPLPIEDTPLVLVDTEDKLRELVSVLNNCDEFAVDLEHHNYRSYLGLTCLIQISTRTTDYVVDPFPMWKSMHILNEPFTNPRIVKVFHAGYNDVIWLQRDFGIYVVNLFDTSVAKRCLGSHRLSLKNLLSEMCGVTLNKKLQMADWRVRPLPEAYLNYARCDSHYLLYCYDKLRSLLVEASQERKADSVSVKDVFMQCTKISERLFEQPRFDEDGYLDLISAKQPLSNNRQVYALKQLWRWRDAVAREHDESLHYVLPTHMMLLIAEALPREMNGILACCAPVPPLVKHDLATLFKCISAARDLPLKKYTYTSRNGADTTEENNTCPDPSTECNRITKMKAKLEYHIDCTSFKADEEIPSATSRVQTLKKFAEEKENTDTHLFLPINSKKGEVSVVKKGNNQSNFVYVNDDGDEKRRENAEKRLKRVHEKLSRWTMPFISYLATKRHLNDDDESDALPAKKKPNAEVVPKTEVADEED